MANSLLQSTLALGFMPANITSGAGGPVALNTATTYLVFGFKPRFTEATKQISKIIVRCSGVTGTLDSDDLVAEVWGATSAGLPNSSNVLETRNTVTATPTGAAFVEFTGFTSAATVSKNVQYHVVLKNAAAVPGTNYPSITWFPEQTSGSRVSLGNLYSTSIQNGWGKCHTTDGATLLSAVAATVGIRIQYSDGTFEGFVTSGTSNGVSLYSTTDRLDGAKFTYPATWPKARVREVAFSNAKSGSPTGNLKYRIYQGTTLLGTTVGNAPGVVTITNWLPDWFDTVVEMEPGVEYAVLAYNDADDNSSNFHRLKYVLVDSDNTALYCTIPGGCKRVSTTTGIANLAETSAAVPIFALLLDSINGEFSVSSGGGAKVIGSSIIRCQK